MIILFPLLKGICLKVNKQRITALITKQGKINVLFHKDKLSILNIIFIRGIWLLFFGIFYYLKSFYESISQEKVSQTLDEIMADNLKVSAKTIFAICVVIISALVGFVGLTILPYYLYRTLFGYGINRYLLGFIIGVYKVLQVYLILYLLKFIPSIKQVYRYNSACNINLNIINGKAESVHFSTNFFNFLINGFLVSLFVVSFVVFPINYFFRVLICFGLMLLCFSVVYEFLIFINKYKNLDKLVRITSFLVTACPSQTENHIVQIVFYEGEFLQNNIEEKQQEVSENKILMSSVFSEVKTSLFSAGITDIAETEWLIAESLGKKRTETKLIREINKEEYKKIKSVLNKRIKHVPLSKIIGKVSFYGREFYVDKNVLSPRVETEEVVEEAIKIIKEKNLKTALDLCTGSGIIGVTLKKECEIKTFASDISEDALDIAKKNAKSNQANIKFFKSDILTNISKKFDMIISNPPYIKSEEINLLDEEVKNYDPIISLDGGEDGLYFYREIIKQAPSHLSKKGYLMFEIGYNQGISIKKLLQNDFENIRIKKDYSKNDRIVVAQLKEKE